MTTESVQKSTEDVKRLSRGVGSKYTNFPMLPCVVVALLGGSVTIGLALALGRLVPYFHDLIMERGPIQFLTIYSFWLCMGMLVFKWTSLEKERKAFTLPFIKSFTSGESGREIVGFDTILELHREIEENADIKQRDLILVQRINKAIKQLRVTSNPAEVANLLKTVADTDAAIINSSYVLIKFMIWAIPVLGFIGTVLGMTVAIGSFDSVLKSIGDVGFEGVRSSLGAVTAGLSVAFDTTFLALVLSALLNLLSNYIQKREEDLLSEVEEFTTDHIINRYSQLRGQIKDALPDSLSAQLAFQSEFRALAESINREMKNLNKMSQVNSDNFMAQMGGVIEAVQGMQGASAPPPLPTEEMNRLADGLNSLRDQLAAHAQALASLKFPEPEPLAPALQGLPEAIAQMNETSHRLGDLFSKIYNRSFA